ncbi:MAG: ArsR/SmtB family transcription factor [Flavobacteriaceae bacterium]
MDIVKISKALSNETRVNILSWLKTPEDNFPPHKEVEGFEYGVCLDLIREKSGLSQSTISQYMTQLTEVGLTRATRIGKWTYFKRNEVTIHQFSSFINSEL